MAKYEQCTDKQLRVMDKISARAAGYKMKIDECNKILAQPVISFEMNEAYRHKLQTYRELYKKASDDIEDVMNQRNVYQNHLNEARAHLDAAETLKKKWGFQ